MATAGIEPMTTSIRLSQSVLQATEPNLTATAGLISCTGTTCIVQPAGDPGYVMYEPSELLIGSTGNITSSKVKPYWRSLLLTIFY